MNEPTQTPYLPLFVYGTLRTGEYNWQIYLEGRTDREIPARLPAHRMYIRVYPFLLDAPEATEADEVVGNLVYVRWDVYEQVLANVDSLEEYEAASDTGWYLRVVRPVRYTDEAGQTHQTDAWVYHAGLETRRNLGEAEYHPSGDWLNR